MQNDIFNFDILKVFPPKLARINSHFKVTKILHKIAF